jgi:hypothetical protein
MKGWSRSLLDRGAALREIHRRGESWLAARCLCFAVAVPALMRLPLPKLDAFLDWLVAGAPRSSRDADSAASTVLQVLEVGRPLVRRGCLTRGMTLYYGLRSAGFPAALRFGMGATAGGDGYDGHCWVELGGEPYRETRDPRPLFAPMYEFGRRNGTGQSQAGLG